MYQHDSISGRQLPTVEGWKKLDLLLSSPLSLQFNIFISWFALKPHSKWKLPSWIIGTFGFKILTNHLGLSFTVDVHELPITQNHTGQNQTVKESSPSTMHARFLTMSWLSYCTCFCIINKCQDVPATWYMDRTALLKSKNTPCRNGLSPGKTKFLQHPTGPFTFALSC